MRRIALLLLLSFIKHPVLPDVMPQKNHHDSTPDPVTVVQSQEPKLHRPSQISELPAAEALNKARLLFIRPRSGFFDKEKLERELLKRKEFGEMGLEVTRSLSSADLVLEVTRKKFTTRFTCNVIEPVTQRVLAGVTASSLGGEIEPHLADALVKEFKAKRGKVATATEEKKPK
jgi:hypothetical protein